MMALIKRIKQLAAMHGVTAALLVFAALLLSSGRTFAQRVNLAKFQSVSANSTLSNYEPIYAVDGVVGNDNRWVSSGTGPHWLQIDFPIPFQFGSAHLYSGWNDGSAIADFSLQYYDGAAWITFPGGGVTGNTATERNVVFSSPVTASRVRLYTTDATARIKELAFFSSDVAGYPLGTDVRLDLAKQRLATASSVSTTHYARNAVDGFVDDSSAWISASVAGPHTLEIDLFTATTIGSAHLYCGLAGQSATVIPSFSLQYFDGTNWQDFSGGVVAGNTQLERQINFTTPASASKVRMLVSGTGPVRVRELAFFPANGGANYPLWTDVSLGAPPLQEAETYSDFFYKLVHRGDGLVLDGGAAGSVLATSGTGLEQQYQLLLNVGTDTFRIRNRANGLCLEPLAASKASGAAVVESTYTGLPHQTWRLVSVTGGYVQIVNVWSGMALDLSASGTVGGGVVQKTPSTATSQHWTASKFTHFPKKGVAGWDSTAWNFNPSWHYNWGTNRPAALPADVEFLPMQWGDYYYNTLPKRFPEWWGSGDPMLFLGFNEPDRPDQADMSVDTVLNRWPRLEAANVPLVSPAPANPLGTWMTDYMTRSGALGNRNDYVATHQYVSPNADALISTLTNVYNAYGRPVLLTEFSVKDWSGNATWTEEQVYSFFAEVLWRFEGLPWLKRYAYYPFGSASRPATPQTPSAPTSYGFLPDGSLSPIGELYAAWDGDATIRVNTSYFIHHKSTHDRLLNPLTGSSPASADLNSRGGSAQWLLVSAPTSGRYYISAARDSRRLAWNGSALSLVAGSTTGTTVEWRTTSHANGWYYIEHVSTGRRLSLSGSTPSTASSSTADDSVRWRFIKPYAVDGPNVAPTIEAVSDYTLGVNMAFSVPIIASDLDAPPQTLTYSLDGAPAGASIDPVTGRFAWTPAAAQAGSTNTVTVRVTDNGVPGMSATRSFVITVLPAGQASQLELRAGSVLLNGVELDPAYVSRCIHILDDSPTWSDTATLVSGNQYNAAGAMIHRSLLSFDLSPVTRLAGNATVTVQSAQVVLQSSAINGTAMTHELRLTDPFGTGANWNTTDGTNPWPVPGGTLGSVLATNYFSTTGTKTWGSNTNLINAVALALNTPSPALYTILRAQGEWNGDARSQFRSATYTTNPDQRPKLRIQFTLDAPLPELIWSGAATGTWNTAGTSTDWNPGPTAYQETGTGMLRQGGAVTFNDSATDFSVNLIDVVKPESLTVNNSTNALVISGSGTISGSTGIAKSGTNSFTLATPNSYEGGTTISGGTLLATHSTALGSTVGTTTVNSGCTLAMGNGVTIVGETASIRGTGVGGVFGALRATDGGNNVWAGPVVVNATSTRIGAEDNANLTVSGGIAEAAAGYDVIFRAGTNGTVTISGTNNAWSGNTSAFGSDATSRIAIGADDALPAASLLGVGNATFDLNGRNQTVAGLRKGFTSATDANCIISNNGAAPSALTLNVSVNQTFPGILKNGSSALALVKAGAATQTLTGASTYTGPTTIDGGTLALSGSFASGVTVNAGTFAPLGVPSVGDLVVGGSGVLQVRINGAAAGTQYDQLTVNGGVALSGTLNLTAASGLAAGSSFTIINQTGTGAVSGAFLGKPNNSIFGSGGYSWVITYNGGDGNDVVLSIATPLDVWRFSNFGTTDNSGSAADHADPDRDGETNLLEFATGQNPNASTRVVGSIAKNTDLEFIYIRSKAAVQEGVTYSVEYSDLLTQAWTSVGPGTVTADDGMLETLRCIIPTGSSGRRFVRLKVSLQAP